MPRAPIIHPDEERKVQDVAAFARAMGFPLQRWQERLVRQLARAERAPLIQRPRR